MPTRHQKLSGAGAKITFSLTLPLLPVVARRSFA